MNKTLRKHTVDTYIQCNKQFELLMNQFAKKENRADSL